MTRKIALYIAIGSTFCLEVCFPQDGVSSIMDLPAYTQRVVIGEGGSYFVLTKGDDVIQIHSGDGSLVACSPRLKAIGMVHVKEVFDFVVDSSGEIQVLVCVERDDTSIPEPAILRLKDLKLIEVVVLDRPIVAWHFDIDGAGNYYLLGIETGIYRQIVEGHGIEGSVRLVHKYSPRGEWLSSSLEIPGPTDPKDFYSRVFSPLTERNQFCVDIHGHIYFLRVNKPSEDPQEWERTLYTSDDEGRIVAITPVVPSKMSFAYSLQKVDSNVLVEWGDWASGQSRILTNLDGKIVWKSNSVSGRIVAVRTNEMVTEGRVSQGVYKIFSSTLR